MNLVIQLKFHLHITSIFSLRWIYTNKSTVWTSKLSLLTFFSIKKQEKFSDILIWKPLYLILMVANPAITDLKSCLTMTRRSLRVFYSFFFPEKCNDMDKIFKCYLTKGKKEEQPTVLFSMVLVQMDHGWEEKLPKSWMKWENKNNKFPHIFMIWFP